MNFKKILIGVVLFMTALLFCGKMNVFAETTSEKILEEDWISGIYVKKVKPNGYSAYQQGRWLRRSSDKKFVYCIQPYVMIDNNYKYNVTVADYAAIANIFEEQWQRVVLLAFYGYGYGNHTSDKWYVITQVMIWRTVEPTSDIYFTDTLNGNKNSSLYVNEMNELENLVKNHSIKPSITLDDTMIINKSKSFSDINGVLSNYSIASTSNLNASINGNNLVITPTNVGEGKVTLKKSTNVYDSDPVLYYVDGSQNVFRLGNYEPITLNVKTNVVGAKVEINKLDSDCKCNKPSGEGLLSGAKYGVYTVDGELIEELTTDNNAHAISGYLPSLGNFVIKEIEPSRGYTLDKNIYNFTVDENNLLATVNVYEKVIKGKLEITKVKASARTEIMTPEPNVKFGIYNDDNLIKEVTTDDNGKFIVELPYGVYKLKQLTTTKGYEYADDYIFTIDEDGQEIKKVISNAEITSKLKVIKIDSETKEVIKRSNIKFKIFDVDNNEYVCQTITYPKASTLCEFETDDEGIMITPYPLFSGTYKLEEIDQKLDGYLWNKESVEFSIDENANLITDNEYGILFETKFENTKVKGKIKITKYGENFIIDNGIYSYSESKMNGSTFGLFKDNELIKKFKITEDGTLEFNNLELGKYTIKELETLDNYLLDEKEYEVELNYKDQYTPIIEIDLDIKNYLKKGTLEFTKLDLVNGEVIPNTTIEIYTENDELIYTGQTDKEGKVIIDDLPIGKYYIIETEASTGYVITDEKVYFEIIDNKEIVKAEMKNKPITGTLEFSKVDFSTSNPLPNTKIQIFNEQDEIVYERITNEEGKIVIDELRFGKYYILETEAPEGYTLNTEKMYFEILEDGEIVKCTMTNEQIVEVPNTYLEDNYLIEIISGVLILIGIGVLIYATKKK